MTLQVNSDSSEQTEQIAENLARHLRGGEVIELTSDLGGGKTTFTRGLVHGLGSRDHVTSPTFKICNVYKADHGVNVYHYDFYRLGEAKLIEHELAEALDDHKSIIVVEWANIIKDVLPKERLTIDLVRTSEESRQITFHYPDNLSYLFA
jgi:tRNA threonylcarbamoyladenosine biosynthesis protein TsaE